MKKAQNFILQREESVISADYETTNEEEEVEECCMDDDEDFDEKSNKAKNLKEFLKKPEKQNDEIIEIESNFNDDEQLKATTTTNNEEKIILTETTTTTATTSTDATDGRVRKRIAAGHKCSENTNNWAEHKNVAEGLMDIALLSANANQLRFLITYNNKASTYIISLGLVALSLTLQVAVGIALIFKRRIKRNRFKKTQNRINEFLIGGVFMVTVINVLLAAFTTTDNEQN